MNSLHLEIIACVATVVLSGICTCIAAVIFFRQNRYEKRLNQVLQEATAEREVENEARKAMAKFFEFRHGTNEILSGRYKRQAQATFADGLREAIAQQRETKCHSRTSPCHGERVSPSLSTNKEVRELERAKVPGSNFHP